VLRQQLPLRSRRQQLALRELQHMQHTHWRELNFRAGSSCHLNWQQLSVVVLQVDEDMCRDRFVLSCVMAADDSKLCRGAQRRVYYKVHAQTLNYSRRRLHIYTTPQFLAAR
jgi:hypothetical protein